MNMQNNSNPPTVAQNQFVDYVDHGWKLCRIEAGTKKARGRGWNQEHNAISDPARAATLKSAGLCHAWSKTCSLDVDRLDESREYLRQRGIDLDNLLAAPNAVQIVSGKPNRAKLLYSLTQPLASKTFADGAFELRCA